jgi:hypothetical protein
LDHDPPPKEKGVPWGILVVATGVLSLIFGAGGTSNFWADALQTWWRRVRSKCRGVRTLVVYMDNGPDNSGRCRQFLKRMIQFADGSGLVLHLVYYPPYRSKYNPVERCWSSLQKKWNGLLLNNWEVILAAARRMTWRQKHPVVRRLEGEYPPKVKVTNAEWKLLKQRLERSATLPKYDIIIRPKKPRGR